MFFFFWGGGGAVTHEAMLISEFMSPLKLIKKGTVTFLKNLIPLIVALQYVHLLAMVMPYSHSRCSLHLICTQPQPHLHSLWLIFTIHTMYVKYMILYLHRISPLLLVYRPTTIMWSVYLSVGSKGLLKWDKETWRMGKCVGVLCCAAWGLLWQLGTMVTPRTCCNALGRERESEREGHLPSAGWSAFLRGWTADNKHCPWPPPPPRSRTATTAMLAV